MCHWIFVQLDPASGRLTGRILEEPLSCWVEMEPISSFWLSIGDLPRDGPGEDRGDRLEGVMSLYSEGTK